MSSDLALLEKWQQQRDAEAFAEIVRRYSATVYSTCRRVLQNSHDAEEVAQECFLHLAHDPARVERSLPGWLHRMATRRSIDRIRRESNRRKREEQHADMTPENETSEWSEIEPLVDDAIAELPGDLRIAIVEHFIAGKTHQEVADGLGVTRSAVTQRIGKGLEIVRKKLRARGVFVAVGALSAMLAEQGTYAVPAALAGALGKLAVSGAGGSAAAAAGGIAVGTKLLVAAVVVVGLGLSAWLVPKAFHEPPLPPVAVARDVPAGASPSANMVVEATPEAERVASTQPKIPPLEPDRVGEASEVASASAVIGEASAGVISGATLYGLVLDGETNTPAGGAVVSVLGTRFRATADADGRYQLPGVPAGAMRVVAASGSLRSYQRRDAVRPIYIKEGDRAQRNLALHRRPVIRGEVRDLATHKPVPGATVAIRWPYVESEVDEAGCYQFDQSPEGQHTLRCAAPGHVWTDRALVFDGQGDGVVNFDLEPEAFVDVTVRDERGQPIEGARIGMSVNLTYCPGPSRTDASGEARVGGVSPSRPQEIYAEKKGYLRSYPTAPGMRSDGRLSPLKIKLEPMPPDKEGYYAGHVSDSGGEPLAGVEIRAGYNDLQRTFRSVRTRTDPRGEFAFTIQNWLEPCDLDVVARSKGYAPEFAANVAPGSRERPARADFVMRPGHWLEGVVVDDTEKRMMDLSVEALAPPEVGNMSIFNTSTKTDTKGRFRFDNLPAGKVRLWVAEAAAVEEYAVDQTYRIVVPSEGQLSGSVVDADSSAPVTEFVVKFDESSRGRAGEAVHSPAGTFTLRQLRHGMDYRIWIEANGYLSSTPLATRAYTKGEGEPATIRLRKAGTLNGILVDAETQQSVSGARMIYGRPRQPGDIEWETLAEEGAPERLLLGLQRATTGNEGTFSFHEEGEAGVIWIFAPGYARTSIGPPARERYRTPDGLRIPLAPGAEVQGEVLRNGVPAPGVRVSVTRERRGSTAHGTTDGAGRFRIGELAGGDYTLVGAMDSAEHHAVCRRELRVEAGDHRQMDLNLMVGSSVLRGHVALAGGGRFMGGSVCLARTDGAISRRFYHPGPLEGDGQYRIGGLPGGAYHLSVMLLNPKGVIAEHEEEIVIEGDVQRDFALEPLR